MPSQKSKHLAPLRGLFRRVEIWILVLFFFFNLFIYSSVLSWLQRSGSLLRLLGLVAAAHGLQRAGSIAEVRELGCPTACGILVPRTGIKPACLALEGGFLTPGAPGKSLDPLC